MEAFKLTAPPAAPHRLSLEDIRNAKLCLSAEWRALKEAIIKGEEILTELEAKGYDYNTSKRWEYFCTWFDKEIEEPLMNRWKNIVKETS